jgi:hypothetical protein
MSALSTGPNSADQLRSRWRHVFVILVILPFVPEFATLLVGAFAGLFGCRVDAKVACTVVGFSVSDLFGATIEAGVLVAASFGFGLVVVWLALCFVAISVAWTGVKTRLALALATTLIFAVLPYVAPLLALAAFIQGDCNPNEGGVGQCWMFGGDIAEAANEAAVLPWFLFVGGPLALGAAAVSAIVIVIVRLIQRRRAELVRR